MSDAPPNPSSLPQKGDLIAGKYKVESVLGAGGMGVVLAASHVTLRQRVAVKFLLPAAMELPSARERFLREARAAAAIQSEHVARVLDVGTLDNGAPYMVMEYLSGTDLGRVQKDSGTLPVAEAVDHVLQACEAIAEAHALGIVHRDLKPANIFLTKRADGSPAIKVLDFGLSKIAKPTDAGPTDASLTETELVIGSPQYMSPEQLRSLKHVDARTDIWSLGVILYLLITGKRPFEGESLPAICASIAADEVPKVRSLRAEVPAELDTVVLRCLEKDVNARTQTVTELARGIAPFGSASAARSLERIAKILPEQPTSVKPAPQTAPPSPEPPTARALTWGQTKGLTQPRRTATLAAGALGLVVVLAVGGSILRIRAQPGASEPAPKPALSEAPSALVSASASAPSVAPSAQASAPALLAAAPSASASAGRGSSPQRGAPGRASPAGSAKPALSADPLDIF